MATEWLCSFCEKAKEKNGGKNRLHKRATGTGGLGAPFYEIILQKIFNFTSDGFPKDEDKDEDGKCNCGPALTSQENIDRMKQNGMG